MPDSPDLVFAGPLEALASSDTRLVDVVDRLLDRGVVIRGELWLTVAGIELVFVGADLVLATPDKMRCTRGSPARRERPAGLAAAGQGLWSEVAEGAGAR